MGLTKKVLRALDPNLYAPVTAGEEPVCWHFVVRNRTRNDLRLMPKDSLELGPPNVSDEVSNCWKLFLCHGGILRNMRSM